MCRGWRQTAPGNRAQGFTLLEILVVMVVIGVVVAAIQLNLFSDNARRLHNEGERLAALLTALADESVTSGQPLAVSFSESGYAFWERDDAPIPGWRSRPGDELFADRRFTSDIRVVELRVRRQPLPLGEKEPARVVFSPAGLFAPFSVLLALEDLRVRVASDAVGKLSVEDDFGEEASP